MGGIVKKVFEAAWYLLLIVCNFLGGLLVGGWLGVISLVVACLMVLILIDVLVEIWAVKSDG